MAASLSLSITDFQRTLPNYLRQISIWSKLYDKVLLIPDCEANRELIMTRMYQQVLMAHDVAHDYYKNSDPICSYVIDVLVRLAFTGDKYTNLDGRGLQINAAKSRCNPTTGIEIQSHHIASELPFKTEYMFAVDIDSVITPTLQLQQSDYKENILQEMLNSILQIHRVSHSKSVIQKEVCDLYKNLIRTMLVPYGLQDTVGETKAVVVHKKCPV
jgi:hypothetical protein